MKDKDLQSEISHIRSLMERSTKFTPLSGLSGIMAGVYAFLGATVVWSLIKDHAMVPVFHSTRSFDLSDKLILQIYIIAATVLLLSVSTAIWLTLRKIEKRGESTRNAGRKELLGRMAVPLVTGGLLLNIFFFRGELFFIAPISLIFYGLALVSGSYYTISLVKYLGYSEIILGLAAALFPASGPYCWITGFGLLHIVYGSIIYYKYER